MAHKRLPLRPSTNTRYNFSELERYALCCYCVFECSKLDAFKVAHPELSGTKNVLKAQAEQFFASFEVSNFIREYREMLDSQGQGETTKKEKVSAEEREERKRKALELLADDLIDQIFALRNGGEEVDRETIIKMVDKIGWFGNEETRVEEPRRYLPTTCYQGCRYRAFVEQECDDLCQYCKYKKYGEDNGVHYDSEKQLEMPQERGENE